jgi:dTMP kinase
MKLDNETMLISLEGIDGSGTTSVTNVIANNHENIIQTQEPTDTRFGEMTRDVISSESNTHAFTDFFFFMGDRIHNVENIIMPALEDNTSVVCDRYVDSTYAYQPITLADESEFDEARSFGYVKQINQAVTIEPDITLLLDVSPETAQKRVSTEKIDKYEESIEFQKRVRGRYKRLCNRTERMHMIDASQSLESVYNDCINVIETFITERK